MIKVKKKGENEENGSNTKTKKTTRVGKKRKETKACLTTDFSERSL
jgi:hypothetical protein